jgi:hypothetical protein
MPSAYVPGSELRLLRRAAKRAGISGADMRDAFGGGVAHLHELNPHWPAFALIGLILEIWLKKLLPDSSHSLFPFSINRAGYRWRGSYFYD